MLLQIIKHTPTWVFVLFVVLIALGLWQTRPRTLPMGRVIPIPLAMLLLSLYGVLVTFHVLLLALVAWALGMFGALGLNRLLQYPRRASFDAAARLFSIPGSWLPLGLMMAIFFTKYAVGVLLARMPALADALGFVVAISSLYGLLSGIFFAGLLRLLSLTKAQAPA